MARKCSATLNRRTVVTGLASLCAPWLAQSQGRAVAPARLPDGWDVAAPEAAGFDPNALAKLAEMIDTSASMPNAHALLIERNGQLVFEHYRSGEDLNWTEFLGRIDHGPTTLHDLRSVTKSVTSLLLGIALGAKFGHALHRPIATFFPDRTDLRQALDRVTLHHVLTMSAGFEWNETIVPYTSERNHFGQLMRAHDPVGFVLNRDFAVPPGQDWTYNSGLTEVVGGVIEQVTGQPLEVFAQDNLFAPLGIDTFAWHRPIAWPVDLFPSASAGLRMRARDLAKIGSLVLHKGQWRGRQIVSADWIAASTQRHLQNNFWGPPGVYGYGYYWFPGTLLTGQQVIRAVGYGDQRLYLLPKAGLSVTLFAGNYHDCCLALGERVLARILRALT